MKNIPLDLIYLLQDGNFHSGEAIGEYLGISRAAVWKQLQKLESLNLDIEKIKGKGYRLLSPVNLLSEDVIANTIEHFEYHHVIDSTNEYLKSSLASKGSLPKGYLVTSEMQEAGKGRRGRTWISPYGVNLYFSLVWSFDFGKVSVEGLSLAVGLAVKHALDEVGVDGCRLKWPNDILIGKKKLAGILLEISGDPLGVCHVIIGVGLNVNMSSSSITAGDISQPWSSLVDVVGQPVSRTELLLRIYSNLESVLTQFEDDGFSPFHEEWVAADAFVDKEVAIKLGDDYEFGVSKGVNEKGELLLETNKGLVSFNGGEVSLRMRHDIGN